jgi:ATP-dependent DNA helicase RecQ
VQPVLTAFARAAAGDPAGLEDARRGWTGLAQEQQTLLASLGQLLADGTERSVALPDVLQALAHRDLERARRRFGELAAEEASLIGSIGRYLADRTEPTMPLLGVFDGVPAGDPDAIVRRPRRRTGIVTDRSPDDLLPELGLTAFRPAQREVVQAALDGRDTLVVMPTGGGKSLCYQLPALASDALTVVVSPLVALIVDQHRRLLDADHRSVMLAATLGEEANREALTQIRSGHAQIVFCAPERFASTAFRTALATRDIALFVVDEAHCVSEWGHDFRPDYLRLLPVIEMLGRPPVMACTATATPKVAEEIAARLGLRDPLQIRRGFDRPNLSFDVVGLEGAGSVARKRGLLLAGLEDPAQRPAIVYCGTRKDTEAVGELVKAHGIPAAIYHAGLEATDRHAAQDAFMRGEVEVVVATNAFGQGIDKQDIRSVWHWALPTSVEAYYQEAGRDGAPARAVLLAMRGDLGRLIQFIKNSELTTHEVQSTIAGLRREAGHDGIAELDPRRQDDRQRIMLAVAERAGAVELAPAPGGRIAVRVTEQFDPAAIDAACRQATDRRWRAYQALKAFAADDSRCRRRLLLEHFGDTSPPTPPAPHERCCDVCDPVVMPELATTAAKRKRVGGVRVGEAGPPVDANHLERLKRWRSARADGKPAYTVATNATLEELLRRQPTDPAGLMEIHGVGPSFVDRHGDDVLELLAEIGSRRSTPNAA